MNLSDAAIAFLELIAPRLCVGCDLPVAEAPSPGPCDRNQALEVFCGACSILVEPSPRKLRPPAADASLYLLGGPLGQGIKRLKYGGRTDLAPPLGRMLADGAVRYGGLVDAVVPVPLHPRRLRARGFNQSALIARPLARQLSVPLLTGRLRRIRPTASQTDLSLAARADNVRGAFAAQRVNGLRVLLVDDVRTTGATTKAAAGALMTAGCQTVYRLSLAAQLLS